MSATLAVVVLTGQHQTTHTTEHVAGQIRDVCGRVIPGVLVTLQNTSGVILKSTSDVDGRYAFVRPTEPGPWTLTAKVAGFLPAVVDAAMLSSSPTTAHDIRLVVDPSLVQNAAATVSDQPEGTAPVFLHELAGTVTRAGARAGGAIVTLSKASAGRSPTVEQCVCDELGRFDFIVYDRGPWTIVAELPGARAYRRPGVYLEPRQRVTMDIVLSSTGR